jgi:hypothetical protein
MFMAIASNPLLTNTNHGSSLPSSPHTLYELSRVPAARLLAAIEDGTVHPQMERRDAIALQRVDGPPRRRRAPRTPSEVANAKRAISRLVQETWMKYPDERAFFLTEVAALAKLYAQARTEARLSPDAVATIFADVETPKEAD